MDDAGLEQAAILLMTVGEEQAAEVFKYLSPKEVQKLGETMARLKTVPRERVDHVLREFNKAKDEQYSLVGDTDAFISQALGGLDGEADFRPGRDQDHVQTPSRLVQDIATSLDRAELSGIARLVRQVLATEHQAGRASAMRRRPMARVEPSCSGPQASAR